MHRDDLLIHRVQDTIDAEHHLVEGNADGLRFRGEAVTKRKMLEGMHLVEHSVAPTMRGFRSVLSDMICDPIHLIVGLLRNQDTMIHTSR